MLLFNKTKRLKFQNEEIRKIENKLKMLSNGKFDFDPLESEGKNCFENGNDQFAQLNQYILGITGSLKNLDIDTKSLSENIKNGNLDFRIDTAKYNGGFYSAICGNINEAIDAMSVPLSEASTVLKKLEVSDYTLNMKGEYKGRFLEFSNLINTLITRLLAVQNVFVKVSNGDTSPLEDMRKIGKRSENDKMMPAAINMMEAIQGVIDEIGKIALESTNGNIRSARGSVGNLNGGYKEIITGVNALLDTVSKPMEETIHILSKMSLNDYTESMSGHYMGDFTSIAKAVNDVRERLLSVQNVAVKISKGDISELENFRKVGRRSENDNLMPAFTGMMETIQELIKETTDISSAAIQGNLNVRGDADKFKGDYVNIIKGINETIDAVVEPINEVTDVMTQMAAGTVNISVKGTYKGQYEVLTNAMNSLLNSLGFVINDISRVLSGIAGGNLNIDIAKDYQGDYAVISDSLKTIIKSLNNTLGNIHTAAEQVSVGANQISSTSQTLSQGSEEQASSVEEVTASITQLAAQVNLNADNAHQANKISLAAKESAVMGNSQMEEMLQAMHDINQSSSSISKIIKVIDDIAFQTNILALNAGS